MLSLQSSGVRLCDRISRREVMRIGGLGTAWGCSPSHLLAAQSVHGKEADSIGLLKPSGGKAKSCIVVSL